GKTHLAVGIVLARIAEDLEAEEARFVVVPDMLDDLRAGYDAAGEQSYYQRKARIQDAPLLVLDDFSLPRLTPWAREVLYMVVNYRYSRELPTVVTMNELPTGEEDPIASRLNDRRLVRPVPIVAQDYRREQ
ncbi:MAG: ATP-binding protein, partial [Chloroflexi bacterium]|nr:ATP-binding protein [Chloroflexota bacterium]